MVINKEGLQEAINHLIVFRNEIERQNQQKEKDNPSIVVSWDNIVALDSAISYLCNVRDKN